MPTVEDILMTKGPDVIVAPPGASILDAARLMAQAKVGSVIVRERDKLLGIFTERDLLMQVAARAAQAVSIPIGTVMSSPVRSCRLHDDLRDCARTMRQTAIRHLAVVEDGRLIGMIGIRDVVAADLGPDESSSG
jgi:CBS domain-containing protein